MNPLPLSAPGFALAAAIVLLPATGAQGQYYSSQLAPPFYGAPYAVEVAPNTYVIRRPKVSARNRHRIGSQQHSQQVPKGVERHAVGEKPVQAEQERIVEDPPRAIDGQIVADDLPPHAPAGRPANKNIPPRGAEPRVIQADAEVTILGPDRISIRLVRKRHAEPNALTR